MDLLSFLNIAQDGGNIWFLRVSLALILIILGVFAGNLAGMILQKFADKFNLGKKIRPSFVNLFVAVLKLCIYIIFIVFSLTQLQIPAVTNVISRVLLTIPAFIGALVLLTAGFTMGIYLREVIEDSEITGWRILSNMVFLFVLYIFGIYAIRTALLYSEEYIKNMIIIIFTVVISTAVAFYIIKKESRNPHLKN